MFEYLKAVLYSTENYLTNMYTTILDFGFGFILLIEKLCNNDKSHYNIYHIYLYITHYFLHGKLH